MTKNILSSAGYLSAASLIEKIGSFIMIPILTLALTSKEYGSLMLAVSYTGFAILFIYNGLHSALFRWYSMWKECFDKKIYEKYIFYIVSGAGLLVITLLLLVHINFYNFDDILKLDFYIFLATLVVGVIATGFNLKGTIWIIENKAYKNLIFIFFKTIFIVVSVYFVVDIYPYAITRPIIEIAVASILSFYFLYTYIFTYPSLNSVQFNEIKPVLKESLIYGWGLQISQISFWVIASSDRIMLANLMNNESVAYYSILMIGIAIMFVIVAFNNSFSAYYNKIISESSSMKEVNGYIFTYLIYGFLLILIYKLFLYYFSDNIILILSTKEYLTVSSYMYITSDIILFYFSYLLFSRYLHAFKMVGTVVFITVFSAVLNLGLNYILIQKYGILGALIGSIIAYLSMAIISFLSMYKKIEFIYMKNLMILFTCIVLANFSIDLFLYKRIL